MTGSSVRMGNSVSCITVLRGVISDNETHADSLLMMTKLTGKHYIDVKWSGFPLTNSPFEGFATYEPEPLLAPEREIVSLRQIPLR